MIRKLSGDTDYDLSVLDDICYLKHDLLLKPGTITTCSYYIADGAFASFIPIKTIESLIKHSALPVDITGSYYDLASHQPSLITIEALTNCYVTITALVLGYLRWPQSWGLMILKQ